MDGAILQMLYILLIAGFLGVFAWFMSKDARKYLGAQNNLSKIYTSILYSLEYINNNIMDDGRFVYIRDLKNKYIESLL